MLIFNILDLFHNFDIQTYKKTSRFLSKDFLYFIVSYTWSEKNNRKK